jgi:hypothetical protein
MLSPYFVTLQATRRRRRLRVDILEVLTRSVFEPLQFGIPESFLLGNGMGGLGTKAHGDEILEGDKGLFQERVRVFDDAAREVLDFENHRRLLFG